MACLIICPQIRNLITLSYSESGDAKGRKSAWPAEIVSCSRFLWVIGDAASDRIVAQPAICWKTAQTCLGRSRTADLPAGLMRPKGAASWVRRAAKAAHSVTARHWYRKENRLGHHSCSRMNPLAQRQGQQVWDSKKAAAGLICSRLTAEWLSWGWLLSVTFSCQSVCACFQLQRVTN